MVVFILLLFVSPPLAGALMGITLLIGAVALLAAFWETALGIVLGVIMFFFLVVGLLNAIPSAHAGEFIVADKDTVHQLMDVESCAELAGDLAELDYKPKGWHQVKEVYGKGSYYILLAKKDKQIEFICANGYYDVKEGPRVPEIVGEVGVAR